MHTLALRLQKTITDFLDQRDALWLRIACAEQDAAIVLKLLIDLERRDRGDVFLLFSAPFVDPEQYARAVSRLFLAELEALDSALAAHHEPPLGRLPERFLGTPVQQLAVILRAARALLPEEGTQRLILAFWPLELADPVAYEQLLDSLVPLPGDAATFADTAALTATAAATATAANTDAPAGVMPQWLRRVRLIGRTSKDRPTQHLAPSAEPYLQRTESDFSPPALQRSLQELIADPRSSPAVRMHTLLMLAALEEAHGSWEAARARYEHAAASYQAQANPTMQTVALLQLGALYQRRELLPAARACYERALTPAAASNMPICVAMLAKNLGDVAHAQNRHREAVACYEAWYRLASRLGDSTGAAQAQAQLTLTRQHMRAPSFGEDRSSSQRSRNDAAT